MAHANSNPGILYQTPHCGADTQSQVNFEVNIPYKLSVFEEIYTNHAFRMP